MEMPIILTCIAIIIILILWIYKLKKMLQERYIVENQLQYDAEHDLLTGLANGTLVIDRLKQSIKNAKRYKKKVAIVYLNLDHFKNVNNSLGTDVGDELLQNFSKKLLQILRESDTVARLGGDEFIVILDHFEDAEFIKSVIDKIMKLSKTPFMVQNHEINLTFSIGISVYPDDSITTDVLLSNASIAMLNVKQNTRDGYQFYTPELASQNFEREKLEDELLKSLEKNEMEIYYQIQIDSKEHNILGMEALLRWNHPKLGLLLPKQFLPLAENMGFITHLDVWVMNTSVAQFRKWYQEGLATGNLSLNLSTQSLETKEFIPVLGHLMNKDVHLKEYLNFELCENEIMKNPQKYADNLERLARLGIQFSLDNFSNGCSSLTFLSKIKVKKIKIAPQSLKELLNNTTLIKAIVSLTSSLNIEIMAVGVETKEELSFLHEYSCTQIQGHLFHKPAATSSIERILKERAAK